MFVPLYTLLLFSQNRQNHKNLFDNSKLIKINILKKTEIRNNDTKKEKSQNYPNGNYHYPIPK
jgi:uncharacterized membrane protein